MKVYKGQQLYYYDKKLDECGSVVIILLSPDGQSFAVRWNDDVVWRPLDSIGKTLFLSPKECGEHYGFIPVEEPSTEHPWTCEGYNLNPPRGTSWGSWRNQNALGRFKKKKY